MNDDNNNDGTRDLLINLVAVFLLLWFVRSAALTTMQKKNESLDSNLKAATTKVGILEEESSRYKHATKVVLREFDELHDDYNSLKGQHETLQGKYGDATRQLSDYKSRSNQLMGLSGKLEKVAVLYDFSDSIDDNADQKNDITQRKAYQDWSSLLIRTLNCKHFNVITFSDDQVKTWRSTWQPATTINRNKAAAFLSMQMPSGGTPTHAALIKAFELSGIDTIILVTDGQPTDTQDYRIILGEINAMNPNNDVVINVIGSGNYFQTEYGDFLVKLAQQNGGQFIGR